MYIGIDVGGTNLKAGLVDRDGTILAVERVPLDFQGPASFARTFLKEERPCTLVCEMQPHCDGCQRH